MHRFIQIVICAIPMTKHLSSFMEHAIFPHVNTEDFHKNFISQTIKPKKKTLHAHTHESTTHKF